MLVLTRKCGETIRIGDDIEVTVLLVRGKHVRLGIRAPRAVAVQREELLTRSPAVPAAEQENWLSSAAAEAGAFSVGL